MVVDKDKFESGSQTWWNKRGYLPEVTRMGQRPQQVTQDSGKCEKEMTKEETRLKQQ